jgi:subtilisin family serine protease
VSSKPSTDTRRQLAVITLLVALLVGSITGSAFLASRPATTATEETDERVQRAVELPPAFQQLHEREITGENVTVGMIDATGFDTDHRALSGRIEATRTFATGTVRNGGRNDHGTAAASVLARTAPNASLYLAAVDSGRDFRAAVAWLLRQDVDVIVAPVAFYGKPGDGSSQVARAAAAAVDRGVVFVAPTGNLGQRHWEGAFDPTAGGVHRFDTGIEGEQKDRETGRDGGDETTVEIDGEASRLRVWLSVEAGARSVVASDLEDAFELRLYRVDGNRTRLVARSQPFGGDRATNERIVASVDPAGTYVLRLRGPANASGVEVAISSPSHDLSVVNRSGSLVAPATGEGVLGVGAYDSRRGRVEPFSSVGTSGRDGVDLLAPDRLHTTVSPDGLVGTSAATPYVGGVVALLLQVAPELTPEEVEQVLKRTAVPVTAEPPHADGAGVVSPTAAVGEASNETSRRGESDPDAIDGGDPQTGPLKSGFERSEHLHVGRA